MGTKSESSLTSLSLSSLNPGDSLKPYPTQFTDQFEPLSEAKPPKQPAWAHAVSFPKISQKFTSPKQAVAHLSMPLLSSLKPSTGSYKQQITLSFLPGGSSQMQAVTDLDPFQKAQNQHTWCAASDHPRAPAN